MSDWEIRALTSEAEGWARIGRLDRAELVNEQLRLRGADPVALPKEAVVGPERKRTATAKPTRKRKS
jgi:hypothetical protein